MMKVLDGESSVYMLLFGFISDMNYFMSDLTHFYFIQLLLITIIYIKMYSVTLTRVMRIFPLHVTLVKTMSGFYVCVLH